MCEYADVRMCRYANVPVCRFGTGKLQKNISVPQEGANVEVGLHRSLLLIEKIYKFKSLGFAGAPFA
jgi:hypothetical protein